MLLQHILYLLGESNSAKKVDLQMFDKLLDETQNFLDMMNLKNTQDANWQRLVHLIHVIDHLQRLLDRCSEDKHKVSLLQSSSLLIEEKNQFIKFIQTILKLLEKESLEELSTFTQKNNKNVEETVEQQRQKITLLMADGTLSLDEGTYHLEAIRWLQRSSTHITRISHHLEQAIISAGK